MGVVVVVRRGGAYKEEEEEEAGQGVWREFLRRRSLVVVVILSFFRPCRRPHRLSFRQCRPFFSRRFNFHRCKHYNGVWPPPR